MTDQDLLKHIVFEDEESVLPCLNVLRALGGEPLMDALAQALEESADPTRAVIVLTRFLERSMDASAETALMLSSPRYLRLLMALFSQGTLLSDILCRNPEYAAWLWTEACLDRARTREEMLHDIRAAYQNHTTFEERRRWMRRQARMEMLRIATREVFVHAAFDSVVKDISALADAMLEAAYIAARDHLHDRYGTLVAEEDPNHEVSFVMLAMGKLGGCELNFSSDIDLLFFYSADGHTRPDAPQSATTEEYYRKLSELIIKAMSEQTAEGRVFRVDMRLRPFGNSGPIACSLDNAVDYYSNYGRAWERQALIKCRPCAGDFTLGELFLERLRPFIYPRYFDDATLEDIRGIKQQTEARTARKAHTEREVKLGRGGIRDIEFTVQILQLLHGGRWEDSRTTNTLEAIRALGVRQRLRTFDAESLERNYIFLRQVEHRLQIEGGQQTHVLPETPHELDLLARRLGYNGGNAFMNVYRERTEENRTILERFLAIKGDGNLWVIELLDAGSEAVAGLEKLRGFGFQDAVRARTELLLLANGPDQDPYTRETAQQFAAILPFLLESISQTPDPDTALFRFGQILSQLPVPATLYNLLKYNPKLTGYLMALVSNSDFFSEMLVRDISLLDLIGTPGYLDEPSSRQELEAELAALGEAASGAPAIYRLRDGETLKIALRDIIQGISVSDVGDELTQLAEVIIENVTQEGRARAEERWGSSRMPFAVLALGKFGGREMGYGSDLDLVFVYDDAQAEDDPIQTSPTEYFGAVASFVLKTLKEPTRYGILYDVDARLRPDGSKGALAIPEQRLLQYYQEEAQFWERFALMKVRAVAGDPEFMKTVQHASRQIAFSPLNRTGMEHLESLRVKLSGAAPEHDLKRRVGGIAEVEFATRLLQLRHVQALPQLMRGGVYGALDILKEHNLLANADYETLYSSYTFFRHLLNRSRMIRGSSSAKLPESPEQMKRLAACLGMDNDMMRRVNDHAQQVHHVYQRIYEQVYREAAETP